MHNIKALVYQLNKIDYKRKLVRHFPDSAIEFIMITEKSKHVHH